MGHFKSMYMYVVTNLSLDIAASVWANCHEIHEVILIYVDIPLRISVVHFI